MACPIAMETSTSPPRIQHNGYLPLTRGLSQSLLQALRIATDNLAADIDEQDVLPCPLRRNGDYGRLDRQREQ